MAPTVDLNADLGEGFPWDEALLDRVTSASISCGAHAGTALGIERTIRAAGDRGVLIGGHPGYPDRVGFGRVELGMDPGAIVATVRDQIAHLAAIAQRVGPKLHFIKPHGALYNRAQRDAMTASAIFESLDSHGACPVLGQPGSEVERLAARFGVRFIAEGFVDRRYSADGRLVPRTEPGAVLDDPAAIRAQIITLIEQGIQTLCIHGDDPHAVARADLVRAILAEIGVEARAFC